MWLFRHKHLAYGTLSRYKARLVTNGSKHLSGIDVDETFSPVVKPDTIWTVLSLATSRHWPVHQLDVKKCLRTWSFYGLKQASRAWFQRFAAYIARVGFTHSRSDSSLFIYSQVTDTAYLKFASMLLRLLSGLIWLIITPVADTEFKLGYDGDLVSYPTLYRSLAGALQCLTFTRNDIYYVVQQVCLYMHDPREPHFSALKLILRYVRGTLHHGLRLFSSSTTSLVAYSDPNWAGCPTTRRSTSGYYVFLGNNLLSWSSKRQPTLSQSIVEAEYRGVAETCWL
ncbi:ribonuclease H-like domain-containing protein [Tanacetum coccineum]